MPSPIIGPQQSSPYNPPVSGSAPYSPIAGSPRVAPQQQQLSYNPAGYPSPPMYAQPSPIPSRSGSTREGGRSSRRKSASDRTKSLPRSVSSMRDRVSSRLEKLDDADKQVAATAVGALVGGYAGEKFGHGTFSTLIGATIGGMGAGALENKLEK